MFGKSESEKRREEQREQQERQERAQMSHATLKGAMSNDDRSGGEMMRYLSETDDVPLPQGETIEQFFSKVEATSNLSKSDIDSDEWVKEYLAMRWRHNFPPPDGLTGVLRGVAFDTIEAERDPVGQKEMTTAEGAKHISSHHITKSEEMKAVEEAARTIAETVQHKDDDSGGGGGLLGLIR